MICKNCGHEIIRSPADYGGKHRFFHTERGISVYCLRRECACERPDEEKSFNLGNVEDFTEE